MREPSEQAALSSEQTALSSEQTALSSEQTALSSEQTALSSEQTALSSEQTALPSEQTALSSEQTALSSEQTALSSEQTALPSEQTALSSEQAALPSEQAALSSEQTALATAQPGAASHLHLFLPTTYCRPVPLPATLLFITFACAFPAMIAAQTVTLVNPSMNVGYTVPVGWEDKSGSGKVRRDSEIYYSGPASLSVDCTASKGGICTAGQTIRGSTGLTLLVGGVLKTEGSAKVSVQVEFLDATQQRFAARRVIFASGTTDWVGSGQQITLPARTEFFRIALTVHGLGKAWLDDVSLSGDGVQVVTVRPPTPEPWEPADLSLKPVTATPGWTPSDPEWWNGQHEELLAMTARNQGPCDIMWFGDSIGRGWGGRSGEEFIPEWRAAFGQYKTLNYSIGGDKTQNVLWRLLHGEGEGIQPRLVIIAIGTNNLWDRGVEPEAVAAGLRRCTKVSRRIFPSAKILVIAPLPVGQQPTALNRLRLDSVRSEILNLFRINPDPAVRLLNCSRKFLEADGTISAVIMPDFVHPSPLGYSKYTEALQPVIAKLLAN